MEVKLLQSVTGRAMVAPPPLAEPVYAGDVLTEKGTFVLVYRAALYLKIHTGAKGLSLPEGVIVGLFLEKARARGNRTYGTLPPGFVMLFMTFYYCILPYPLVTLPVNPKMMQLGRIER